MRSPRLNAMGPRAAAGWPSNASAAATLGAARATTRYHEDRSQVNDSKNLILAVVLSALVLLGWTWAANRYFPPPTRRARRSRTASSSRCPQPQAQPVRAGDSEGAADRSRRRSRRRPRVSIRTPSLAGSINLKGAQIDDLLLRQAAADDRQEFAAGAAACRRSARRARISPQFGWTAPGRAGAGARHDVDRRQPCADARASR